MLYSSLYYRMGGIYKMRNIFMGILTIPLFILCFIGLNLGMGPAIVLGAPFMVGGAIFILVTELKAKKAKSLNLEKEKS